MMRYKFIIYSLDIDLFTPSFIFDFNKLNIFDSFSYIQEFQILWHSVYRNLKSPTHSQCVSRFYRPYNCVILSLNLCCTELQIKMDTLRVRYVSTHVRALLQNEKNVRSNKKFQFILQNQKKNSEKLYSSNYHICNVL